ncbi:hypothetical protein DFR50_10860 [Roseiarcus fermentans]|uniref:Uncharacterized protein n=1 Tax=Roseiarcus fermentans TaxID=1473586 RepID=A0A366FLD2_9HYPH|nr:hypothetical protein [Roseiarcus fermentans]RBP15504.1 hypothetical protein DFR50_10860 [Roseiarcus fermentans]
MPADTLVVLQFSGEGGGLGEIDPGLAHVEDERLKGLVAPVATAQSDAQRVVQHILERPAVSAHLLAQQGLDIGFERDCRPHEAS